MFRVGQRLCCVCADWRPSAKYRDLLLPKKGDVVIASGVYPDCSILQSYGITLKGYPDTRVFASECFRPVVEPKTELPAEITALLDPANHKPLEPARRPAFDPSFV